MDVLKEAESGKLSSVSSRTKAIARYAKIAKDTTAKNKTISIRISAVDLMKLKAKATQEGMPYQTLIASSIHRLTV